MQSFDRVIGHARTRVAAALLVGLALVAPALAAGPRLATPNQKTLIETDHFGTFYIPKIASAGRTVVATWRGPNQFDTVRTIATSTDGGATFTYKLKPVRIPVMAQVLEVAGDAAGHVYFAGTTGLPNQLAIVRTDAKFKGFSAPTLIESDQNIVGVAMAAGSDGRIYLAYQTSFAIRLRNGVSAPADQVHWAVSADGAATFQEFVATNAKPADVSDHEPTLATAPDGSVYLLNVRDETVARAAAPEAYTNGAILVTRIDVQDALPAAIARTGGAPARGVEVRGFVAADGSLGIAWADLTVGGTAPVQTVYFGRFDAVTGAATVPPTALATVGSPAAFHLGRTSDGHVVVILHGAGFDSKQPEPAIIGRASTDDGSTFGPVRQVTGYPSVTSLDVTSDGRRVYGLWTDTRMVRFSAFAAKPPKG